jgi:hypothetical protein
MLKEITSMNMVHAVVGVHKDGMHTDSNSNDCVCGRSCDSMMNFNSGHTHYQ